MKKVLLETDFIGELKDRSYLKATPRFLTQIRAKKNLE